MVNARGLPFALRGAVAPTYVWAPEHEIEHAALDQLRNISKLPWVHGVRAMPDVHLGKGATVGSVIAMRNAVSPSAVGVDIGCGMGAIRTSLTAADLPDDLGDLRWAFEEAVPVGFRGHDGIADAARRGPLKARFDALFGRFDELRADRVQERGSKARSRTISASSRRAAPRSAPGSTPPRVSMSPSRPNSRKARASRSNPRATSSR